MKYNAIYKFAEEYYDIGTKNMDDIVRSIRPSGELALLGPKTISSVSCVILPCIL